MEFNDGMKDGFDMIRNAFMKAVGGQDPKEFSDKVQRIVATGGKAAVEKSLDEFPPQKIETLVRSVYGFVAGRELAEGVSTVVQSVNLDDLQTGLDGVLDQFKSEEASLMLARQLKGEVDKDMLDAVKYLVNDKINAMEGAPAMVARMVFEQFIEPTLERYKDEPGRNLIKDLRLFVEDQLPGVPSWQQGIVKGLAAQLAEIEDAPAEEVAAVLRDKITAIPTDAIAMQLYIVTQSVTPERVMGLTHKATGQMPSPTTVSGVFSGVANAALKQLNRAADPAKADAPASLDEFRRDAMDVVSNAAVNDNSVKKKCDLGKDKDKGGKFKI